MAWPGIFTRIFDHNGAGPQLRSDILPLATASTPGVVRSDNTTTFVDPDTGELSAASGCDLLDIKWSLAALLDPGFLDLSQDNGLLLRSAYPDAWAKIATSPNLLDDSAFQAQVTAQGSCGAFSRGDGTTTFRVPLLRKVYTRAADPASGLTAGMFQGDAVGPIEVYRNGFTGTSLATGIGNPAAASGFPGYTGKTNETYGQTPGGDPATVLVRGVKNAPETRPVTVVVTPYIKMYGALTDTGEANIAQLIQQTNTKLDVSRYEEDAVSRVRAFAYVSSTGAILSSYGISGVTRSALGRYTVSLLRPFASKNYAVAVGATIVSSDGYVEEVVTSRAPGSFELVGVAKLGQSMDLNFSFIVMGE